MATLLAVPSAGTLDRSVPAPTPRAWDPRLYQIATLGALLVYGVVWLDLEVRPLTALAIVAGALVTQHLCARLTGRAPDLRSALISALSLCLLLRTGSLGLAALAAVVAIASKFVLRLACPEGEAMEQLERLADVLEPGMIAESLTSSETPT